MSKLSTDRGQLAHLWWKRGMLLSMVVLIVALWVVFFGGLSPSDRSEANRPESVLPLLQVNQFAWLANPTATEQWPSQILALRDARGILHTWEVPMRDTHYLMPNDKWLNANSPCTDFRPDPSKEVIACWDQDLHAWGKENYQWDFSGKNIRGRVEDLPSLPRLLKQLPQSTPIL